MKAQLTELLAHDTTQIIDTHNTKSIIFVFTSEGERFGLKVEYGEAKVTRDEAHWYEKVPDGLKKHFVGSAITDDHAFVLLRWFDGAPTIEQCAMTTSEGESLPAIDAYLDALRQDEELFASSDTVALTSNQEDSFFRAKFFTKLEQASSAPYLHNLLTSESVTINGRTIPGPIKYIDRIHQDDSLREYLSPDRAGFIHGDLHSDNLIIDNGNVYMVDPNGLDYLPIEYDHGRVIWSLTGWNAIVRHEHTLHSNDDGSYELAVPVRDQYTLGMQKIKEYFQEYSLNRGLEPEQAYHRALYSSAMQYLSRADHAGVEHEATALHLRGLEQLAELFEQLGIDFQA
jgi:hypothetical protein